MQHHAHVARTAPPHMRAHHMAVPPPPPHSQPQQSHMQPPINMTHAPPPTSGQQQQPLQNTSQQQQQKQQHHLTNGPTAGGSAAVITGSVIGAPAHLRDHHTRLNQHQQSQHPPLVHNSTQLQKLRQQHQHINNNNISTNKNNYHHHHQTQQYNNSASNTHCNALPSAQSAVQQQPHQKQTTQAQHHTSRHPSTHQHQQHSVHHQQQQQQQQQKQLPPPQQQQHPLAVTQMPPQQAHGHLKHQQTLLQAPAQLHQQQQQQIQTSLHTTNNVISGHAQQQQQLQPPAAIQHPQQPPVAVNYYTGGAGQSNNNNNNNHLHKSKYNNSVSGGGGGSSAGGMPPKTILQNPNRVLKARLHSSAAANNIEVNIVGSLVSKVEAEKATKCSNSEKSGDEGAGVGNVIASKEATVHANVVPSSLNEGKILGVATRKDDFKNAEGEGQNDALPNETINENVASGAKNINLGNETISGNITNNNNNNNILSNEDNTVPKNSKEKTPMCLVNELARFNKITHQYRLTSEKGPAHCKRFTVTLKLGEEEYSAEGFKIKKAQHLAAADAIEKTKYKHPVPKVIRRNADGDGNSSRANITPTVELNALAMKLGQETYYLLDPRQVAPADAIGPPPDAMLSSRYGVHPPPPPHALPPTGMGSGHMLPQHPPPPPPPPHVRMMDPPAFLRRNGPYAAPPPPTLLGHPAGGPGMRSRYGAPSQRAYMPKYGQQQRYHMMAPPHMSGGGAHNGMTHQPPPQLPHPHHGAHPHRYGMPASLTKVTLVVGKQKFVGLGYTVQQAKHDAASRALQVLKTQANTQLNEALNSSLDESDNKSPISLVHEIGIQRSMTVHFKVLREEGPAHMKKFVTACVVGSIVTEGEGNGKKISKKRAAEKMWEELKKLPPLTPTKSPVKRIKVKTPGKGATAGSDAAVGGSARTRDGGGGERRKRSSGSIKEKSEVDTDAENPITLLIQLQQNRKEKEPVFELIAKNGNENSRRREFIMEVTAHGMVARGTGNSKKLAKRNAAQNLLIAMSENDSVGVAIKTAPESAASFALPTAVTTEVTSSLEHTKTVLQPIAEIVAAAAEPHIDLPVVSTPAGQVPGILILRHNKKHAAKKKEIVSNTSCPAAENSENKHADLANSTIVQTSQTVQSVQAATTKSGACSIVNESEVKMVATNATPPSAVAAAPPPANNNVPNTASNASSNNTTTSTGSSTSSKPAGVHMKDQLLYLAKLLGFEVNFSDYPKGNHSEFLTIVTLSSNPPQICHGVGTSAEESQNDAARNALKILSELGLNNAAI